MKPEAQLSRSLYEHLALVWKPKCVYFAVPNSLVARDSFHVANMKRQGLTPGVTDWVFLWWNGCGGIELKVNGNKQTPAQKGFEQWCNQEKVPYRIAESIEQCYSILKEWKRL